MLSPNDIERQSFEQRQTVALVAVNYEDLLINKFSKLSHLLKIASYCIRFAKNCQLPRQARTIVPISSRV